MSTRLIVHVGLHKTATGWLQRRLFPRLEGVKMVRSKTIQEPLQKALKGNLATLLISHEGLSGTLSPNRAPGAGRQRLEESLARIAEADPNAEIIVGFREQESWINSAYSQRAKKTSIPCEEYIKNYSEEEFFWCHTLDLIESSFKSVFVYLYEELEHNTYEFIEDLCMFIGTEPPTGIDSLVRIRENASPRTRLGQVVTRQVFKLSYALDKRMHIDTQFLRFLGGNLSARAERLLPAARPLTFDAPLADELRRDWNKLLDRAGRRRGRDFTSLSHAVAEQPAAATQA